jgi:hypothetical protein
VWSDLGNPPKPDEIEVTVIGPGHGESVVVHLGAGEWLVVDSCVDPVDTERVPAPLKYLRGLGVQVERAVKLIVVSHWDDDHIKGIAEVVRACTAAKLSCSVGLTEREFNKFVERISIGAAATRKGNVGEFRQVLDIMEDRGDSILRATPGRTLIGTPKVVAWSPSDFEDQLFLRFVIEQLPVAGGPLRRAVPGSPNLTSVVLSIEWTGTSVLLGGDMEAHPDNRRGWEAIATEGARIGFPKGHVVKVPHHGSHTGHHDRMWAELLDQEPISVIAPFGRGRIDKRPPKSTDVRRINALSSATFLTAKRGSDALAKKDVAVNRSLREGMVKLASRKAAIGMVRLRRNRAGWQHTLFGSARRAK